MSNLIERALRATSFEYCDSLFWREKDVSGSELQFFINCNDAFAWACADCEQITEDNIAVLEQAYRDCEEILGRFNGYDGGLLFCARVREMRVQGAMYKHIDPRLWDLFDAAGPVREPNIVDPRSDAEGKQQAIDALESVKTPLPDHHERLAAARKNLGS